MSKSSGTPDSNAKPSLVLFDSGASVTFGWEGNHTLGSAYVQIVDNSGTPIVSFGGGTQYADAAATPTHPTGTMPIFDNAGTISKVSNSIGLPVNILNSSLAVTGTFWQATQPVSIASMPSTPVTGTFWQATQPVSIASMPSTPVTGTFWQATQPISLVSTQVAIPLWGHGATAAAVPANGSYNGAQARSSEISAATNGNLVGLIADLVGKLIVLPYANPENFVNGTTAAITDTTSTSTIAAQGAGVRTYITQITVTNSHATVGTFVKILDGTNIIHEGYAAAAGGGYTASFPTPLRGSANTAINTQPVTTGANIIASVSGYKGV